MMLGDDASKGRASAGLKGSWRLVLATVTSSSRSAPVKHRAHAIDERYGGQYCGRNAFGGRLCGTGRRKLAKIVPTEKVQQSVASLRMTLWASRHDL